MCSVQQSFRKVNKSLNPESYNHAETGRTEQSHFCSVRFVLLRVLLMCVHKAQCNMYLTALLCGCHVSLAAACA